MDEERLNELLKREKDPNAVGSRAWHRRELEAANRIIGMGVIILAVGMAVAFFMLVLFAF